MAPLQLELFSRDECGDPSFWPRLFFGLRPPPADAAAIWRLMMGLAREYGGGDFVTPDRLHLSLAPIVSAPLIEDRLIKGAQAIGDAVRGEGIDVIFDRIATFNGRDKRPVVLCCSHDLPAIVELAETIAGSMRSLGLSARRHKITPHMTLWYSRRNVPLADLPRPVRWKADRLWLIHSLVGKSRHRWPGQWKLKG